MNGIHMKNIEKKAHDKLRVLKQSIGLVLQYKKYYLFILLFLNTNLAILPYFTLFISKSLLNMIGKATKNSYKLIVMMLMGYVLLTILSICLKSVTDYLTAKYAEYLYMKLNISFTEKCKYLKAKDYENSKMYDALSRAEQQIGIRPINIFKQVIELYKCLISIVIGLIVMARWNKNILILFLILPFLTFKYFDQINKEEFRIVKTRTNDERYSWYISYLLFKDYNIKEIKTFGVYDYFLNQFSKIKEKIYTQNLSLYKKKTVFAILNSFMNVSITLFVYVKTIFETINGSISIGTLVLYISSTKKIEEMINAGVHGVFALFTELMYADFIFKFYDLLQDRKKETGVVKISHIDKIEFKNISYKYAQGNFMLNNINCEFSAGHNYAIIGKNGSGKSTIIKLISGLYDDYSGEILINGINLRDIDKESYTNAISVLFQDFNSYEMNAKDNILIGDINQTSENDERKFETIAKITGVDEFIKNLPYKYNQQLGSWFKGGTQLSGGQWQKIAMARCMFKSASVYLYDEATSALDITSERNFYNILQCKKDNIINICVTHRIKNIQNVDKVLFIEDGEIKKEGDYDDIIKCF